MSFIPHSSGVRLDNLLRMADYIETVPQEKFDMYHYRNGDKKSPECDSVGCVIGHSTILDPVLTMDLVIEGEIFFSRFDSRFCATDTDEQLYLFSSDWKFYDNTPAGAAQRIRFFVKNGLPENWREYPLDYLNEQI
jgi:hypothetical protein